MEAAAFTSVPSGFVFVTLALIESFAVSVDSVSWRRVRTIPLEGALALALFQTGKYRFRPFEVRIAYAEDRASHLARGGLDLNLAADPANGISSATPDRIVLVRFSEIPAVYDL